MGAPSALATAYLVGYNAAAAAGWAYVLAAVVGYAAARGGELGGAHGESGAGDAVAALQLASLLEVAHAALGLTKSGVVNAFVQWFGRSHVALIVIGQVSNFDSSVGAHWMVSVMYVAWALADLVRYPHYVGGLLGASPRWLEWLRYTLFIPLYPIGVAGEVTAIWLAMPAVKAHDLFSIALPNVYNQSWSYYRFLAVGLAVLYPVLFSKLYLYMFKQRAKRLGGGAKPKVN
eukprot:PRCOL_00000565-RA